MSDRGEIKRMLRMTVRRPIGGARWTSVLLALLCAGCEGADQSASCEALATAAYTVLARRGTCPSVAACQQQHLVYCIGVHVTVRRVEDPATIGEIAGEAMRLAPTLVRDRPITLEFYRDFTDGGPQNGAGRRVWTVSLE